MTTNYAAAKAPEPVNIQDFSSLARHTLKELSKNRVTLTNDDQIAGFLNEIEETERPEAINLLARELYTLVNSDFFEKTSSCRNRTIKIGKYIEGKLGINVSQIQRQEGLEFYQKLRRQQHGINLYRTFIENLPEGP